MAKLRNGVLTMCLLISSLFSVTTVYAAEQGLTGMLMGQLGVSESQAQAGAGSIFKYAKENLSKSEFAKVAESVPGIKDMMAAAPKSEKSSGGLAGLSSMFGGDKLGSLAGLTSNFNSLGLNADMLGKFTPIILEYVKKHGGEAVKKLLSSALGGAGS